MAGLLRLDALDADDLQILSAYCQDGLTRPADCRYLPREGRFVLAMNRFVWERADDRPVLRRLFAKRDYERRRAILDFARVSAVRQSGIAPEAVLSLLAIRFQPAEAPAGTIELVFAGDAAIRLDVECIEARLTDEAASWSTENRPDHERPEA
ncbi:hypothetical protein GCM10011390_14540 [Aureimonas endophytica]|uniref:DUF2948 family protein n=1 Tax=Aureimonas endophytica TaxID=2027858 RepID=A0A916ZGZ7_9HYPH|nr:DUF2948 family protein [Aureimonas endophytica]GGD96870.1 hypothetical protein GCM10011390_14540 [Aureimonas endophytica]